MRFTPVALFAGFSPPSPPPPQSPPSPSDRPAAPAYQARAIEARDDQAENDWEAFINLTGKGGPFKVKLPKVEARDQPAHDWSLVEMPTPGPKAKDKGKVARDNNGVEVRGEEEPPFSAEFVGEDKADDSAKDEVVRRRHHESEHLQDHPEVFQLAGRGEPKPYKQNLSKPPVPTRRGVKDRVGFVDGGHGQMPPVLWTADETQPKRFRPVFAPFSCS